MYPSENSSFNDNVDEFELEKVRRCTAKSFSHSILAAGKNSVLYKSDVRVAYKLVPAKIEVLRLQGFAFMDMMFCENMMAFDGKPSVANYDAVGNTIFTLALVNSSIPRKLVDRCVDDLPCVSPKNNDWGDEFMRNCRKICNDKNVELAPNCPMLEKAFENTTYSKVKMNGSLLRHLEEFSLVM
jgi:hypothetical protein